MKKIVIATDFSENANDAAKFALQLAERVNAEVTFVHVYALPIQNAEFPEMIDFTAYEDIKKRQLNKVIALYSSSTVKMDSQTLCGFSFFDELETYCSEKEVDLVVMGLTGASRIAELFLGSNTLHVLTHSSTPVLAVPKNWKLTDGVAHFAFAYDERPVKSSSNMHLLNEFCLMFDTRIRAFHVTNKDVDEREFRAKFQSYFPNYHSHFEISKHDNVDLGILEFIHQHKVDMLAMIPRKYSFFDRLFHVSHTKEIAHHINIPLLVLPE